MSSEDQFENIVRDYYQPLFRFAMSLARNESDASDLTQQTFYVWATRGHQLRDAAKIKTWLFTTLYRSFLMSRRGLDHSANDETEPDAELLESFVQNEEFQEGPRVLSALGRVDELFRAPIALFYLEDISYAQIAETLELPIGTVKSRIARGIAQLRRILLSDELPACPKPQVTQRNFSISHCREHFAAV